MANQTPTNGNGWVGQIKSGIVVVIMSALSGAGASWIRTRDAVRELENKVQRQEEKLVETSANAAEAAKLASALASDVRVINERQAYNLERLAEIRQEHERMARERR
jgi:translation initiation factor 2B subunit (eIF-2B alpha/beta/delta family)